MLLSASCLADAGVARSDQECSNVLSTVIAEAIRPLLEQAPLCSGLRTQIDLGFRKVPVGIDKTSEVSLRSLQYCPGDHSSRLSGRAFVRCETSQGIHTSLSATVMLDMTLDNQSCAITAFDFDVESSNDLVKELLKLLRANQALKNKVQAEIARHLSVVCQPRR